MPGPSTRGLDPDVFEWVCSGIIGEVAAELDLEPTGMPQPMASNYDGGVDAKITTKYGDFAIQCKAFANFSAEARSIQQSFRSFLGEPYHGAVTTYAWCSTNTRTVRRDEDAEKALAAMLALATGAGRDIDVRIFFANDLDRIIREHRPEYFGIMAGHDPLTLTEIARLSELEAAKILTRLGPDDGPQLEFPAPRTANFLGRVDESARIGSVVVDGLGDFIDELHRRARAVGAEGPIDARSDATTLTAALEPLTDGRGVHPSVVLSVLDEIRCRSNLSLDRVVEVVSAQRDASSPRFDSGRHIQERVISDQIRAYGRGLVALLEHVELFRIEADAVLRRRLLISGPWGTGKSYQVATYTRRRIGNEQPVLLLRARDFTWPDASIITQPWRAKLRHEKASPEEFIAMLDGIGQRAENPLVVVIDGLNESSIRDIPGAVRRLVDLIDRFPNVRLIVTDRQDRQWDDYEMPRLAHCAPDRATLSRALEAALRVPPGTRWHAALANPLLASVAARVVASQRSSGITPISILGRVALLDAWIQLLVLETTTSTGLDAATVQRIVNEIANSGGQIGIRRLARAVSLNTDIVDVVIRRLLNDGLLEESPSGEDAVRFLWQGAGDLLCAQKAAIENGINGIEAFIQNADEANRMTAIETIAEIAPALPTPIELPDIRLPGLTGAERDTAFAWSLAARGDDTVSSSTLVHAKRLLLYGGENSEAVIWSVLGGPWRRKLGPAWLNEQLRACTLVELTQFWPFTLEQLANNSAQGQDDLAVLLTWYAQSMWSEIRGYVASTFVELLAWVSCAGRWTGLRTYAVQGIVEILRHNPHELGVVLERLRMIVDDHPKDALFAAAAGVVARWPTSEAATIVRGACERALQQCPTPQSFRSLAELHRVLGDSRPMHTFLHQTIRPLRRRRLSRGIALISEDDRAMFADRRDGRAAARFEATIWDSFGLGRRHLAAIMEAGATDRTTILDDQHGRSLIRGRWLARQHAAFPFGSRMSIGARSIKAGTFENLHVQFLTDPAEGWDDSVDPSIPVALSIYGSDDIRADTWWAIRPEVVAGEVLTGPGPLLVVDPDGVRWVVIEGNFRVLEPGPTACRNRPTIRVGTASWVGDIKDDGRPHVGDSRHEFVRIERATLTTPRPEHRRPEYFQMHRFSEVISAQSPDGVLVSAHHDGAVVAPPTATLLGLLKARWTGDGIDCRDTDGALLVTDPSVGSDGPHAVLVRWDALEKVLHLKRWVIKVEISVTDLNARTYTPHRARVRVTLGG